MDFVLNGRPFSLDADVVRASVAAVPPDSVQTHWVEIDGERWPVKQAFRIATGIRDAPFISHYAVRVFKRLGFKTSDLPSDAGTAGAVDEVPRLDQRQRVDAGAVDAFMLLDRFLSTNPLTATIAGIESQLEGSDREDARAICESSGLTDDLVDSALIVRERVGMLDTLVHAAVIIQVIPMILEPGETVLKRPSLGAGNDPGRVYDLETTKRVAEFKLSSWKGRDSMRQRNLFADVVGLSLDTTGRRRQVFVVGELPVRFLTQSRRNAAKTLSKAALKLRTPDGLTEEMSVSTYTDAAHVEVIDLTTYIPKLR